MLLARPQVALGLRREAGQHAAPLLTRGAVPLDDLLDEVEALGFLPDVVIRHGPSSESISGC